MLSISSFYVIIANCSKKCRHLNYRKTFEEIPSVNLGSTLKLQQKKFEIKMSNSKIRHKHSAELHMLCELLTKSVVKSKHHHQKMRSIA